MKSNKIIILILAFISSFSFISCVEDGDFTVPQNLGEEENLALQKVLADLADPTSGVTEISIANLKDLQVNDQAIEITSNIIVKGYVTSTDYTGNFYKEIYIQDAPENPTAAIKVAIELVDSYNKFNVGREVYIKLQGLYIGEIRSGDGVITIGGDRNADGDEVENLSLNQVENLILRSGTTSDIIPINLTFSELNNSNIGMFVKIDNVQFPTTLAGKTYVDANDQFDTQRTIESCNGFGYSNFILETSAFASFKFAVLPEGGGSIAGIVSRTFNGSDLVLVLNDILDVNMNGNKCTPLNINDFTVIFEENFDTGTDNTNLDFANWTNFAEAGNELWTEQIFSGNGYAEFSGFRTNDAVNIGWLVSPGVNISSQTHVFVNFMLAQHHLDDDQNNTLEVFVSTDFDGTNVTTATWNSVTANVPNESDTWYQFKDGGLVDVSSYSGTLFVGFKYTGSGTDTNLDGAYMVDDFKVLAK